MKKLKEILKRNDVTILQNPFCYTIMLGYSKERGYYMGKNFVGKTLEVAVEKAYDFLTKSK